MSRVAEEVSSLGSVLQIGKHTCCRNHHALGERPVEKLQLLQHRPHTGIIQAGVWAARLTRRTAGWVCSGGRQLPPPRLSWNASAGGHKKSIIKVLWTDLGLPRARTSGPTVLGRLENRHAQLPLSTPLFALVMIASLLAVPPGATWRSPKPQPTGSCGRRL